MAEIFCSIDYPDRTGFKTSASSLFEAGANALRWAEVDCRMFGSARRFRDDQVLVIGVGMVPDRFYRVGGGAYSSVDQGTRETGRLNSAPTSADLLVKSDLERANAEIVSSLLNRRFERKPFAYRPGNGVKPLYGRRTWAADESRATRGV